LSAIVAIYAFLELGKKAKSNLRIPSIRIKGIKAMSMIRVKNFISFK
jgi:hypothetical protein